VVFAPEEEEKQRFVLAALKGEIVPPRRKHTRLPIELPVRFRRPGSADFVDSKLSEISIGGALLQPGMAELPDIGSELVIELLPPGSAVPMSITGRVAYHHQVGTGIKFLYRDGGGSRRLRELIRRIRSS
jgi:hypothetical protein